MDCNDGLDHLNDLSGVDLDAAVDGLLNADSVVGGAHAAADLLQGIGDEIQSTMDGICLEGLGDDIEVIGEPLGEAGELAFGIIGESVEAICEVSMAVSSPIVGVAGELHHDAGSALHSGVDAIEHVMAGDLGEAAASVADIAAQVPDITGDLASALAEVAFGTPFEVVEGACEIAWELGEGIGEMVIDPANENGFNKGNERDE